MSAQDPITFTLFVRLFRDGKCFGPGIAELLTRVDRTRSLRSAAMEMNLAYSKAWRIMKESEQALGFALLNSQTGGVHGGGAVLTEEARAMLEGYEGFVAELNAFADEAFERRFGIGGSLFLKEK